MTLRLPAELEDELRIAAQEDHRSAHQTVVFAVAQYLSARETAEIKSDPETLRSLAEARESEVVMGSDAVWDLVAKRNAS